MAAERKPKRNWIQEESAWGNPWFPHEPTPSSQPHSASICAYRRAKPGSGGGRLLGGER